MLPNLNMLFQLMRLPETRVTDQISSTLNFKNGGPRLQRILWNKIQNFKYLACREKQSTSLDLNRTITVSVFSRYDVLGGLKKIPSDKSRFKIYPKQSLN